MLSIPRRMAAMVFPAVLGGTAVAETPMLAGQDRSCEVVDDPEMLELGAVMQIIKRCQDELGLSDAQREELATVTLKLIAEAMRREERREAAEEMLAGLLQLRAVEASKAVLTRAQRVKLVELLRTARGAAVTGLVL